MPREVRRFLLFPSVSTLSSASSLASTQYSTYGRVAMTKVLAVMTTLDDNVSCSQDCTTMLYKYHCISVNFSKT